MSVNNNNGSIFGMNNGPGGSISFDADGNVSGMQSGTSTTGSKILVIDGGSLRGLPCLMVIDEIMKAVVLRGRKHMLPCDVFDLICGTSMGGFISVLLGRLGLDCSTAIEHYEKGIKLLLKDEHDIIWDKIAESRTIDTAKFREYLNKVSRDRTESAKPLMNMDIGRDLLQHSSTKTIVTVTEGGAYPPRCHLIRSYTPQNQQRPPASLNLQWTIPDALMATMASPIYMDPHKIQTDKQRRFKDAGSIGYNNPIDLASREWKDNSPGENVGTIICLGTGLGSLLPQPPPSLGDKWKPSEQYVLDMCHQLSTEKFTMAEGDEDVGSELEHAMRDLICIASNSFTTHRKFQANSAAYCDNYYRIDEHFGLSRFDLVDVYQIDSIKDNVKKWLKEGGSQLIDQIASRLVEKNDKPQDKYFATFVTPPPPPPDTVKDYNPHMDEPRPTRIQDYLKLYEVMFIVDDSGSMKKSRWNEARDALLDIADYAFQLQTHTVSMRFMNHPTHVRGLQGSAKLKSMFDSVKPRGPTPTGEVLKSVFDEHLKRVETAIAQLQYSNVPPLDVIVITDGEPTDRPAEVIAETVKCLKNKHYHPNTMGVQFVQIGDDPDATRVLKELIKGDTGSMIDTVPYRGKLSVDALKRVLLGGMHPNVRATLPVELLGV